MLRPRGRRELTTMQVAKQLSTGQSWLPDWTREALAKVNLYQSGRLCVGGSVNQATTRMWCWMNQAATKSWRRDVHLQVSSLVLGVDGTDEQDDYICPRSILHREAGGRSWAINNTPNVSGVE